MSRRVLFISAATPSASGTTSWRRFQMLARYFRDTRHALDAILVRPERWDHRGAERLLEEASDAALVSWGDLRWAVNRSLRRRPYTAAIFANPELMHASHVDEPVLKILDLQRRKEDLSDLPPTDLILTGDRRTAEAAFAVDLLALEAPFLGAGARKLRPALKKPRPLAGCWVESTPEAADATQRLFHCILERGGGGSPNFAIAGPGAGLIDLPRLPFPVTMMPDEIDERVFYRGLDIAMAPDVTGGAPRLDVIAALEHGATPLASSAALGGLRRRWRLPHFARVEQMADFLFERGAEMRDGGLLTELRARADWTWSGLVTAAARQRARLAEQLQTREMRQNG